MDEKKNRINSRRTFLKYAGLASSAGILAACAPKAAPTAVPTEAPVAAPTTPPAQPTAAPVATTVPAPTAVPTIARSTKPIIMGVSSDPAGFVGCMVLTDHPQYFVEGTPLRYDYKNGTFNVVPGAAHKWEILDDGLRYRLYLRDNVMFHDGTQVDSEAFKFYYDMQTKEDNPYHNLTSTWRCGTLLTSVQDVVPVDKLTLDVVLNKINPAQLEYMSGTTYAPPSPTAIKAGQDVVQNPVGYGVYRMMEHTKGVRTVMERFDGFYDDAIGRSKQIILRPIAETSALLAALEAGEVSWVEGVPPEEVARLSTIKGIRIVERKTLYVWFMHLDMRKPPLDNVLVRQALNYAVDKESLIRDVLRGAGERSYAPLSRQFGNFYAGDEVTHYDYNPQKAKDLLAEAGFPNGFSTKIYTNTGRVGQQKPIEMCEFIQANWKAVGVEAEIEAMEWAAFEDRRIKGEFEIASRGWTPATPDPDSLLLQNFHSDYHPPKARGVAYMNDPEVDKLLMDANSIADRAKRVELIKAAQKRIVDLAPWVFIDHEIAFEAMSDEIQDYVPWAGGRGVGMLYAWHKS